MNTNLRISSDDVDLEAWLTKLGISIQVRIPHFPTGDLNWTQSLCAQLFGLSQTTLLKVLDMEEPLSENGEQPSLNSIKGGTKGIASEN